MDFLLVSRKSSRGLVVFGTVIALALAACGGSSSSDGTSAPVPPSDTSAVETLPTTPPETNAPELVAVSGGTLKVAVEADPVGLNPQNDAWGEPAHVIGRAIFDTLMTYDKSGKIVDYLAESVTANADATVWTIKLRPGIKFHNDEPLNASAVQANIEAAQKSMVAKSQVALIGSTKVIDDLTLEVTMTAPWAVFPNLLTGGSAGQLGYMAAPAMLSNPEGSRNPIGTGPFVFKEWNPDDHISVTRNDSYWQKPAYLDEVVFRTIPDSSARSAAFDAGDVDVLYTASTSEIKGYLARQDKGEVNVTIGTPSAPDVLVLNTKKAPLDDIRVRKALALGLDWDRLLVYLEGEGVKQPMHGPYGDTSFWYAETGYPNFDLEEAKKLIAEYTQEKGQPEFDYKCGTDPWIVGYAELLQSMWADVGIKVNIVSQAQAQNIGDVLGGNFQLAGWSGIGGDDPDNDYKYFHTGGLAVTGYSSATMDAAMEAGRASSDQEKRKTEYAKVQQELTDNMPYIWTGSNQFAVIAQAKTIGINSFILPDGSLGQSLTGPRFFLKDVWLNS